MTYSEHELEFTFAKNDKNLTISFALVEIGTGSSVECFTYVFFTTFNFLRTTMTLIKLKTINSEVEKTARRPTRNYN